MVVYNDCQDEKGVSDESTICKDASLDSASPENNQADNTGTHEDNML